MKSLLDDVREFHMACDIPVLAGPMVPAPERVALRLDLHDEEHLELHKAVEAGDLVGIADGLADIIYIAVGTALEFGIPLDRVWAEVQRSNMAKVDPVTGRVVRRADGKILKPEGWTPPDLATLLDVGVGAKAAEPF
jgi:predicted HAD superfamily Cof-like phosphohydrolase